MHTRFYWLLAACLISAMPFGLVQARAPQPRAAAAAGVQGAQQSSGTSAAAPAISRVFLNQHCVTCHSQRLKTGGLELETLDTANLAANPVVWEKVLAKVRGGLMPPTGRPRPEPTGSAALLTWLESELDRVAAVAPNAGRKDTFHRLNRAEYKNVVRDLLALDVDVTELLPTDDASYGFDNIAGVLMLNPSLMERYLSASRKISRSAIGAAPASPGSQVYRILDELPQTDRVEGLPFGTRGGALVEYNAPRDAEYEITIEFACSKIETSACDAIGGFPDTHELEVAVDDVRAKLFTLEPKRRQTSPGGGGGIVEVPRMRARIPLKGGPHEVGVAFLKLPSAEEADGIRARFDKPLYQAPWIAANMAIYQPVVERITISGPFDAGGIGDTPSRRAVFSCKPSKATEEAACAKSILSRIARRAYRRPVTESEVQGLLKFYAKGRADRSFDDGIEMALRALLVSPEFLFRVESDPATVALGANYRVTDLELASRLSFFLWSSIPDDELLTAAIQGRLKTPAVLERQVQRMLADPRSVSLTANFAAQWLQLAKLESMRPADGLFPNFDEALRDGFRKETELFFDSIVRDDRSAIELLTANYTFVNERLARHYNLPYVRGSDFRRVTFPSDSPRRGLLGQGSVLMLTSQAIRTSPVQRGKWVLQNILGTPPPNPPANVPSLEEKKTQGRVLTMRERMAEHRANPVCATCHSMIDPLGFALENFNPIGQWRTVDDTFKPIDSSGTLPDGTKFADFNGFRTVLLRQPGLFANTVTERLLTYALGRGLEYYDLPTVRRVVRESGRTDYKFSSIVLGIVKSAPFQMRRSLPAATPVSVAAAVR